MTFKTQLTNSALHTLPIIGAFFAPATYVAILVFIFVIVDTYLGRKAARHRGEKITSNRFSDVFAKVIGYAVFLSVGLLINIITGWAYGVWMAAIVPIYTEITSIDENQKSLGKKGVITQAEEVYKFALNIKKKRDQLR